MEVVFYWISFKCFATCFGDWFFINWHFIIFTTVRYLVSTWVSYSFMERFQI